MATTIQRRRGEVMAALIDGPVPFRKLMHGRSAGFRLAYDQLLREGKLAESGMGTRQDPKWSGLPGAEFPPPRPPVRPADVRLLVRSGLSRDEAKRQLKAASLIGEEAVVKLLTETVDEMQNKGLVHLTFKDRTDFMGTEPTLGYPF
jgi:hypothetical protein